MLQSREPSSDLGRIRAGWIQAGQDGFRMELTEWRARPCVCVYYYYGEERIFNIVPYLHTYAVLILMSGTVYLYIHTCTGMVQAHL